MSNLATAATVTHRTDRTKLLWAGGTVFDVVLDQTQTGGAVALLDQVAVRGDTTPMHIHRSEAEIFYVLDGEVTAWSGDDVIQLELGSAVYLPPNQPHAISVRSASARIITVTSPAGFANFVRAAGVPASGDVPASWTFDLGAIMAAAPEHDIEIVGPPPVPPTD